MKINNYLIAICVGITLQSYAQETKSKRQINKEKKIETKTKAAKPFDTIITTTITTVTEISDVATLTKIKETRDSIINHQPPYDISKKIVRETTTYTDSVPKTAPPTHTETHTIAHKIQPIRELSYDKFRKANIYLLKSEIKDYHYQYTYFDDDKGGALTLFTMPITERRAVTHFQPSVFWTRVMPISLVTVPFKIRPDIQNRGQQAKATTNLGIMFPLAGLTWNRLFADTGVSKHILSLQVLAAPSIEEFDSSNTNGQILSKHSKLVLSGGVAITYTYNDIAFSVIPAALDYGMDSTGKKWVYHDRYWWGFGIGISPTLLWRILK